MASSFRSLAASAVLLVLGFVVGPAPSSFAHTGNVELPVTLVINDVCTLNTEARRASVACVSGGQYRIYNGEAFAKLSVAKVRTIRDSGSDIVEIAF